MEISSGRWELSFSKTVRVRSPSTSRQVTAVLSLWPKPSISPGPSPRRAALEAADGGAVGEQGDRLARVGRRQAEHRALKPRLYLGEGLAPLHPEVREL